MPYFLRHQGDATPERTAYPTKRAALDAYAQTAWELDRYGQKHTATMHGAADLGGVREYPDFVLSLGPRGGIRCDRA